MSNKAKKILSLDERGRITLPSELREGIDSYSIESKKDGVLQLIPQKSVSVQDAKLLDSLKASVSEVKKKKTKPVPKEWLKE